MVSIEGDTIRDIFHASELDKLKEVVENQDSQIKGQGMNIKDLVKVDSKLIGYTEKLQDNIKELLSVIGKFQYQFEQLVYEVNYLKADITILKKLQHPPLTEEELLKLRDFEGHYRMKANYE